MKVHVLVYESWEHMSADMAGLAELGDWPPIAEYTMDHDDPAQRRVLGEQCRNAFEGGQLVVTYPVPA